MMKKLVIVFSLLTVHLHAHGHPVSFKDSIGVMGDHSPLLSNNQINYSFDYWFALGLNHIRRPDWSSSGHATFASANFLLKRWNTDRFQANLYTMIGAGVSELSGQAKAAGLGLLQFDIENRRYYFLAKHMIVSNEGPPDLNQTIVRTGFAPYLEKFDGIHTWIILEWQDARFEPTRQVTDVTPFIRLFYRNILIEIGQSTMGMTKFNFISHF